MIIIVIILLVLLIFKPFVDVFKDYRGKYHIILWYNTFNGERKYFNILGNQS